MTVIVSFTTSPTRINKIKEMVDSILLQTKKPDFFILNIPKVFKRTNETYDIPNFLKNKDIILNILDVDYGPATKLIGGYYYIKKMNIEPQNARIIYLDDDISYPDKMIEEYCKFEDNYIRTITGFDFVSSQLNFVTKHNVSVQIAEGYGSVCVPFICLKEDFMEYMIHYTMNNEDTRLSDDIIISNYFHKNNNKIIILNNTSFSKDIIWINKCVLDYGNCSDALHCGANGTTSSNSERYLKVIKILNSDKSRYFKIKLNYKNNTILI